MATRIKPFPTVEWIDLSLLDPRHRPLDAATQAPSGPAVLTAHRDRALVLALQPELWRLGWMGRAVGATECRRQWGPVSGAIACGWARALVAELQTHPDPDRTALAQGRDWLRARAFDDHRAAPHAPLQQLRALVLAELPALVVQVEPWWSAAVATVRGWPPERVAELLAELRQLGLLVKGE